ncbi:MAG: hemerythrin domain-containing protein [Proteobacteria bacterium]|nr:MAG: hemerythrin domain-containing protein [Pseudomonadota bacterium]
MEEKGFEVSFASDAITFLERQHRVIERLFMNIESFNRYQAKQKFTVFQELAAAISQHSKLEESVFYPALGFDLDLDRRADFESHHLIAKLIFTIQTGGENHQFFHTNIIILKEILQRHFVQEETKNFPWVRSNCSPDHLVKLGDRLKSEAYKYAANNLH